MADSPQDADLPQIKLNTNKARDQGDAQPRRDDDENTPCYARVIRDAPMGDTCQDLAAAQDQTPVTSLVMSGLTTLIVRAKAAESRVGGDLGR